MQDDPFARAVERAQATEQAQAHAVRQRRQQQWSSGNRTAFRTHATVFVAVNLLLFMIWLTTWQLAGGTSYPWFLWPLLGWGVGLAAHYAAVRNHLHRGGGSPAAAQPAAGPSKADELARLADLHRAGSLSDEEFTAAKADLLGAP
ncbi:MAG: 2TM domain-containing protein [Baekduiaceae bacterium]